MDNKSKGSGASASSSSSSSSGEKLRERTTTTPTTTETYITKKATLFGFPYERWLMLIGLLFALLLCLGFFVRCGGTPATPQATAVAPVATAVPATAVPAAVATAVPATAAPAATPTAVAITLPKITLPALPILAGAASALEGTGAPNTKYNVYDGDKVIGTVTTDASGKWKFDLPALSAGDHTIKLVPLGADGKEIAAGAASVVLAIKNAVATAVAGVLPKINLPTGAITADKPGTIDGTGEPNTKYNVYDGDKVIGTVTTDASGKWKFELPALSVGDHTIKLVPLGADGKEVAAGAASVVLAIKNAAAAAVVGLPKIILPGVNGAISAAKPGAIEGTGDPNTKYTVYDGDKAVGTVTTDASGKWKFELPVLTVGNHVIKLVPMGADGKEIPASAASVTVNATAEAAAATAIPAPTMPTITALKNDTVSQGGIMRGTGAPGSTVVIYDGDKEVGSVKVDAKGNWQWKVPLDYALGDHTFKVATKGADGKLGAFSAGYKVKVIGPVTLPVTGAQQAASTPWLMALIAFGALVGLAGLLKARALRF